MKVSNPTVTLYPSIPSLKSHWRIKKAVSRIGWSCYAFMDVRTYEESNISRAESIVVPSILPSRSRLSLVSTRLSPLLFLFLPIMAKSTMTVDYCPRWITPGDRVQVHRKTRSSEVSCDFPQGPQIILCRRSFWNSTVFLRTSKQSRTLMSGFSQIPVGNKIRLSALNFFQRYYDSTSVLHITRR